MVLLELFCFLEGGIDLIRLAEGQLHLAHGRPYLDQTSLSPVASSDFERCL